MLWLLLLLGACDRAPSRDEVIRRLVTQRLVPDQQALSDRMQDLTGAISALRPGADLKPVQQAWRAAALAWDRVYVFRLGPIVENSGLLRARFWPLRSAVLAERVYAPPPLDPMQVDQLGIDLRGIYALEWLLFVDGGTLLADSERGALARTAAGAFALNVQAYANEALTQLRDGGPLADKLCEQAQATVSKMVNQLVGTVEALATDRLATVLEMHAFKNLRASEVVGAPSGSSRELVLAQLRAADRMYRPGDGNGLSALVLPVAPAIDERVRARFDKAVELVNQIDGPLEVVVVRDRKKLEEAFRALKELEVALKVDLASALGVTLTFTAGDGD
jgi:predicted lipoprotein